MIALAMALLQTGCLVAHEELYARQCVSDLECNQGFFCREGFCNRDAPIGSVNNTQGPFNNDDTAFLPATPEGCRNACVNLSGCGVLDLYLIDQAACEEQCQRAFVRETTDCILSFSPPGACSLITDECFFNFVSEARCDKTCARIDECGILADEEITPEGCLQDCLINHPYYYNPYSHGCVDGIACARFAECGIFFVASEARCEKTCEAIDACGGLGETSKIGCQAACLDWSLLNNTANCIIEGECSAHPACHAMETGCLALCLGDADCEQNYFCDKSFPDPDGSGLCRFMGSSPPPAPPCTFFSGCEDPMHRCEYVGGF